MRVRSPMQAASDRDIKNLIQIDRDILRLISVDRDRQDGCAVLGALRLPARVHADPAEVYKAVLHDKKMGDGFVSIVSVDTVGSYQIQKVDPVVLRYGIDVVVRP